MNSDNESSSGLGMGSSPIKTGIFSTPNDSTSNKNLNPSTLGATSISTTNLSDTHGVSATQVSTNPVNSLGVVSSSVSQASRSSLASNQPNSTPASNASHSLNPFNSSSILPQNSSNQDTSISSANSGSNTTSAPTFAQSTTPSSTNTQTASSPLQNQSEAAPSPIVSSGKPQTSSNTFLSNSRRSVSSNRTSFSSSPISSNRSIPFSSSIPAQRQSFFTKGKIIATAIIVGLIVLALVVVSSLMQANSPKSPIANKNYIESYNSFANLIIYNENKNTSINLDELKYRNFFIEDLFILDISEREKYLQEAETLFNRFHKSYISSGVKQQSVDNAIVTIPEYIKGLKIYVGFDFDEQVLIKEYKESGASQVKKTISDKYNKIFEASSSSTVQRLASVSRRMESSYVDMLEAYNNAGCFSDNISSYCQIDRSIIDNFESNKDARETTQEYIVRDFISEVKEIIKNFSNTAENYDQN